MPRHAHHEPAPPPCCSCCCGCAGAPPPPPCYYPAPSSSAASDHLLHAIAAHLLLSSPAPPPPTPPQPQPQPQPAPPAAHHVTNPYPYPYKHHQQQQEQAKLHAYTHPPSPQPPQPQHCPAGDHGHLLLHSLLRRVAALECALPGGFPATPPSRRPPHPIPRPRRAARYQEEDEEEEEGEEEEGSAPPHPMRRPRRPARAGPSSAGELAARTIQAHFRRFLARRSRTLRQLKELAVLRSKAAAIRGSLSGRCGGATDPSAVSEAAMGLLLRLDAIQGGDPMIREGKRAVSRELTRILEFVDKVLVKEHEQMAAGGELDSDEYHEGFDAAFVANRPAVNKKVSFSGNGQIPQLNGERENGHEVDEGSESTSSAESDEVKGMPGKRSANGKAGLAAPMPVHMESRRIAGERR